MNIAFFGTPGFVTDFVETLVAHDYSPTLIITAADRPVGRGMTITAPAPKVWAESHNIKVLQPEKLDDAFFEELSKTEWDLFVVVAYGKIIPERVINLPKYGTINVHYSLLPKYRGATPVESAILNGDTVTSVTIQQMAFKLDTGAILAQKQLPIETTDTTHTLRARLNNEAYKLLPETIGDIFSNTVHPVIQDETQATYSKKITKEDGLINLADKGVLNDRKYRAYYGWPGSYFFQDGKRIKITKAHLAGETFVIDEVIPENGKRMSWDSYVTRNPSSKE